VFVPYHGTPPDQELFSLFHGANEWHPGITEIRGLRRHQAQNTKAARRNQENVVAMKAVIEKRREQHNDALDHAPTPGEQFSSDRGRFRDEDGKAFTPVPNSGKRCASVVIKQGGSSYKHQKHNLMMGARLSLRSMVSLSVCASSFARSSLILVALRVCRAE